MEQISRFNPTVVVDAFGGGGAVTLACAQRGIPVIYNDILTWPERCLRDLIAGNIHLPSLLLSREEFLELREQPLAELTHIEHLKILINSFGNQFAGSGKKPTYLYAKEHADTKYALAKAHIAEYGDFEWSKHKKPKGAEKQLGPLTQLQRLQQLKRVALSKLTWNGGGGDFREIEIPAGALIYCDPPYRNTSVNYGGFDFAEFDNWVVEKSTQGHVVLISEYTPLPYAHQIAEFGAIGSMAAVGRSKKVERLFQATTPTPALPSPEFSLIA